MNAITSLMEHGDGKFKMTASIFGGCLSAFLFSWLLIFGVGGAVGIAIGVSIAVISLVLTAVFGAASVFIYLDWLDKG